MNHLKVPDENGRPLSVNNHLGDLYSDFSC